jgi:predicted CopG family antitoxin
MSTKTIAVDARVYARLASARREGESFSRAIDRLLTQIERATTGRDILRRLESMPPLSVADAGAFLEVVAENRAGMDWDERDLR